MPIYSNSFGLPCFFCQPKGTVLSLFLNFDPAEDPRLSRQNVEVFPQLRRKVMGLLGCWKVAIHI